MNTQLNEGLRFESLMVQRCQQIDVAFIAPVHPTYNGENRLRASVETQQVKILSSQSN